MTARAGAQRRRRGDRFGSWRRTAAWYRPIGVTALALGLGVATGRADLVLLAAPLLLGAAAALIDTRPLLGRRAPQASAQVDVATFGANIADVVTEITDADSAELVSVAQPGIDTGPIGSMVTIAGAAGRQTIRSRFSTSDWGRTAVTRPDSLGAGPDGLYVTGAVRYAPARSELILPAAAAIDPIRLPPLAGGWAGAHLSRRPGQGSDLIDLREFAPGDRLRQVHWRAYARHQRLYTRRTLSDAEAELMICLDLSALHRPRTSAPVIGALAVSAARTRTLVRRGRDATRAWLRPQAATEVRLARRRAVRSSLDLAVAAAAAVAAAHLRQGDRVGLMTATVPQTVLRPGSGDRQLQRLRHRLALLDDRRRRPLAAGLWGLAPGQIVVWCSPMTTESAHRAVTECAARGHRVIVVDTLPTAGLLSHATADEVDHLRVLLVERERAFARLRGRGVPVVHWDRGAIDTQLADVVRVLAGRRG